MGRAATGVIGGRAEQVAFEFLIARGLEPVARNFRSRGGEIDLIMLDGDCLAFIEVRYRASERFIAPSQTVDHRKQQKLIRTAALFLVRNKHFGMSTMRFDVVSIRGTARVSIDWITDAFRPNNSSL